MHQRVDIEISTPMGSQWQIYPYGSIWLNLYWPIKIDISILKNIPWQDNIFKVYIYIFWLNFDSLYTNGVQLFFLWLYTTYIHTNCVITHEHMVMKPISVHYFFFATPSHPIFLYKIQSASILPLPHAPPFYVSSSTYQIRKSAIGFWGLAYFTKHYILQLHPFTSKCHNFMLLYDLVVFHCVYIAQFLYSFIHWSESTLVTQSSYHELSSYKHWCDCVTVVCWF